jgi:hypothetical protein
VAGTGQAGGWGVARLLLLCAVLGGLFLMHGAPATAAEGCHSAVPAAVPVPMPMGEGTAAADSLVAGAGKAMAHPVSGTAVRAPAPSMAHGAMCVSTPARQRFALPAHGLPAGVAMPAVAVLAGRAVPHARMRRGPPPPGGRGLLLLVSVART